MFLSKKLLSLNKIIPLQGYTTQNVSKSIVNLFTKLYVQDLLRSYKVVANQVDTLPVILVSSG